MTRTLTPWRRPTSALSLFPDLDELWHRMLEGRNGFGEHLPEAFRTSYLPPLNIAEGKNTYKVTMDCPGLEENDFKVEILGDELVISGERRWEDKKEEEEFRRVESQYGRFERSVRLPADASFDPKDIEATYKKGILTLKVPKSKKAPAARIPVKPA